jgi:hypothetical protein
MQVLKSVLFVVKRVAWHAYSGKIDSTNLCCLRQSPDSHQTCPSQSNTAKYSAKTNRLFWHLVEESIGEIRENMEFFDSLKDLDVCVVRLNPVDYESILKSQEHSLCVMKAQRCVVVHVLNGHKAKAEKWQPPKVC